MVCVSEVKIVMDEKTFEKFNEIKNKHEFSEYTIEKKFNFDDIHLICINLRHIDWHPCKHDFVSEWYKYINDNKGIIEYYEIMVSNCYLEYYDHFQCGMYEDMGYFLSDERTIKLLD